MATEAGGSRPLTQFVAGNGQSAVSYTLPAGLFQYIQSVVAIVDTSASGDVTPLLTVTDDANIVVADKQQGQAIDAGGSGRATWALRLTDEQNVSGFIRYNVVNTGRTLDVRATDSMAFAVTGAGQTYSVTTNGGVIELQSNAGAINIRTDGAVAGSIFLEAGVGDINLRGDTLELKATNAVAVRLAAGNDLTVFDSGGNPIFRVHENGDLQGKTGKALVFNL